MFLVHRLTCYVLFLGIFIQPAISFICFTSCIFLIPTFTLDIILFVHFSTPFHLPPGRYHPHLHPVYSSILHFMDHLFSLFLCANLPCQSFLTLCSRHSSKRLAHLPIRPVLAFVHLDLRSLRYLCGLLEMKSILQFAFLRRNPSSCFFFFRIVHSMDQLHALLFVHLTLPTTYHFLLRI